MYLGSSPVSSTLGFRKFIIFIRLFSYSIVVLVEHHSEAFSIFQTFYNKIRNQFGISIRTLHTDNANIFYLSFAHFMSDIGIIHYLLFLHPHNRMEL